MIKSVLVHRKDTLKDLEVKGYNVYSLLSRGSAEVTAGVHVYVFI